MMVERWTISLRRPVYTLLKWSRMNRADRLGPLLNPNSFAERTNKRELLTVCVFFYLFFFYYRFLRDFASFILI